MDFFAQQDRSRSRTTQLVFLFVVAVVAVVIGVFFAIQTGHYLWEYKSAEDLAAPAPPFVWIDWGIFFWAAATTLTVIYIGSVFKINGLKEGGSYIVEQLGGRLVNRSTHVASERTLLNVTEEMAIASGIPVPLVYILDNEDSINAIAAGDSLNNAVIAVTAGCLTRLNRDELQGIVAHEFSHILNGDMRLNIRLIGLLSGVMIISGIGQILLRISSHDGSGKVGPFTFFFALFLIVIGFIGHFFGRLIQCAVCRQREFLADAAAVQFTRNPAGISSALKKIAGLDVGSKIRSPHAGEVCHLFFSSALKTYFATHPPLVKRIKLIDHEFDDQVNASQFVQTFGESTFSALSEIHRDKLDHAGSKIAAEIPSVGNLAGNLSPEGVGYSAKLLKSIPDKLRWEIENILGAGTLVCALLLSQDSAEKNHQFKALAEIAPPEFIRHLSKIANDTIKIKAHHRLPLVDLAIPTLRLMSPAQYARFNQYIQILVESDGKLSLFEFALQEVVARRLGEAYRCVPQKISYTRIDPLLSDVANVLSILSKAGQRDPVNRLEAIRAATKALPLPDELLKERLSQPSSYKDFQRALDRFAAATPPVKKMILDACARCVLCDQTVTVVEGELLRTVASSMGIPLPPFMPGPKKEIRRSGTSGRAERMRKTPSIEHPDISC